MNFSESPAAAGQPFLEQPRDNLREGRNVLADFVIS
jgi:hypothetical protein